MGACSLTPPRVRRASGFVQIFLSQVPRRETLGSPRKLTAGALVDRKLRFNANFRGGRYVGLLHRNAVM